MQRKAIIMRITDSQQEKLEWASEDLAALAHLLERIISQNLTKEAAEQLIAISRLWESVLETSKQLTTIRNYDRRRTNIKG